MEDHRAISSEFRQRNTSCHDQARANRKASYNYRFLSSSSSFSLSFSISLAIDILYGE